MKVITGYQMKQIQRRDIQEKQYSQDDFVLIVAMGLQNRLSELPDESIAIVCGDSENGQYGFALANLLKESGQNNFDLIYFGDKENRYYQMVQRKLIPVQDNPRQAKAIIEKSTLVVDCLFGSEINEMITYPESYLIDWINQSNSYVLSCDCPSGLDCDNGSLWGCCVKANATMALQFPKLGMYLKPGCDFVGKLLVEPVGFSFEACQTVPDQFYVDSLKETGYKVPDTLNYGETNQLKKTLVFAGNKENPGSAVSLLKALQASGCQSITLASSKTVIDVIHNHVFDASTIKLDYSDLRSSLQQIRLSDYQSVVLGNMEESKENSHLIHVVLQSDKPVVLYGNAVGYLLNNKELLKRSALTVLIAEMEDYKELFDRCSNNLVDDSLSISAQYPSLALVYSQGHLFTFFDNKVNITSTSIFAMNKAGLNDVLAGMIAGFVSNSSCIESIHAANAVYCQAIQLYCQRHSGYGLTSQNILQYADQVLMDLFSKK